MVLLNVQLSDTHFKSYYQENSLLIQLILKELNDICLLTPYLKTLQQTDIAEKSDWLDCLNGYLINLIGEHDIGAFSSCEKGPLARLKDYCYHFQPVQGIQDKTLLNLTLQVNQIDLNAKQLWHLIHAFTYTLIQRKKNSFHAKIKKQMQVLLIEIESVLKIFLLCLKKFDDDENVLFFLIRKKNLLLKIYGAQITNHLFELFSKERCLATLLIKRFKSRGFEHLLPLIRRELFFYESNKVAHV